MENTPSTTEEYLIQFYKNLRAMAGSLLSRESPGITLQATALVHEAYLRLDKSEGESIFGDKEPTWENRAHFLGSAAEAMRRVLIDHARKRQALKRGGDRDREYLELDKALGQNGLKFSSDFAELLSLDSALKALEEAHADKANVVKLRYFAGLTIEETADTLGISNATCKRYWAFCKAWLKQKME